MKVDIKLEVVEITNLASFPSNPFTLMVYKFYFAKNGRC